MGSGLAVLTPDSFTVYSPTAREVFEYSHSMNNPVISSAGSRAVIYESNRTSLKVANNHNILFHQEMPNNIIHAHISDSNRIAVTTRSDSYNGEVSVYNYNMDKRFTWYCATGFPVYSALSDRGKTLAVVTVQTVNGILQSSIYVIDAAGGQELFRITSGDYPRKLMFSDDTGLIVAYSDSMELWNISTGTLSAQLSFTGHSLLSAEKTGRYVAVAYGSYTQGTAGTVVLADTNLGQKFSVTVPETVRDVSISRSRVYVLGSENLYEYGFSAELMNTVPVSSLAKGLVTWNGTVLIDSTSISRVEKTSK